MSGTARGSRKEFHDVRTFTPGGEDFAWSETAHQCATPGAVRELRHAGYQTRRDQIVGTRIQAALGSFELQHRARTNQELVVGATAQIAEQGNGVRGSERELDGLEARFEQTIDRLLRSRSRAQAQNRNNGKLA